MRLATMNDNGVLRPALLIGDRALDLDRCAAAGIGYACPGSVLGILRAGETALAPLRALALEAATGTARFEAAGLLRPLAQVRLAAPLPDPRMVFAVGANYREHLAEMNTPVPDTPLSFQKSLTSIVGTGDAIILPASNPDMVDWEGEFCAVIGKECFRVGVDDALDHVAGYTIVNDVSARDWVAPAFHASGMMNTILAWEHNILGKLFPTFCPMGPAIVTADEIGDPAKLRVQTRLNGETMQDANTSDLVFNVAQIIAYYSKFFAFMPGDVIATGSPSGVGFGRKPPVFMKAGDTIEVEIEGIGILSNPVIAEQQGNA